jgi:hypothetical protein
MSFNATNIHVYAHTYTHIHIYIHKHMYIHIYTHKLVHLCKLISSKGIIFINLTWWRLRGYQLRNESMTKQRHGKVE